MEDVNGVHLTTNGAREIQKLKKSEINIRVKAREKGKAHTTALWIWKKIGKM